jgi:uncharacterized protein YndB with AHSA1/START domain
MNASADENTRDGIGSALAPIELDTLVPCTPGAAFNYFTDDIGRWWPLSRYSCSTNRAVAVSFEGQLNGKLIETDVDGRQYVWGTVLDWVPGNKVSFSWHPGRDADNALTVAITFQAVGAMTRVRLVHAGWERLGASAAQAREPYANGWPTVLGRLFKEYCEHAAAISDQPSDSGATPRRHVPRLLRMATPLRRGLSRCSGCSSELSLPPRGALRRAQEHRIAAFWV